MTNKGFDLIPFAEVKAMALKNPDVREDYDDIQVRKALAAQLKSAQKVMALAQSRNA